MANQRLGPDPSGFTAENEIDLVLGNGNPNPTRVGCPPQEVLTALARRERPTDDPAYDHLIKCSPCYREVRALQQAAGERRVETSRSRTWWMAAAAVFLLAIVGASWLLLNRGPLSQSAEFRTQLDLRPYAVTRGAQQQSDQKPLVLPRGRVVLTMLLPVGSEPGPYEVQVLDANLGSKVSANGNADLQNHVTTLQATLDTGSLSAGDYKLAVRRTGDDWQLFPAQVQ